MKETLLAWGGKRPRLLLALALLSLLAVAPFLPQLELDFGARIWYREQDPQILALNHFEATFGTDDALVVAILAPNSIFNPQTFKLIQQLTESLWTLPDIARVDSLSNYHWSYAAGDTLVTGPFLEPQKLTSQRQWQLKEQEALASANLPGHLMDRKAQVALLYATLVNRPEREPQHELIYRKAQTLVRKLEGQYPDHRFYLAGQPALNTSFKSSSFSDLKTLVPVMALLILLYLIYCFRSFYGVLIPVLIIGATLIFAGGLIALLGIKINSLTFVLPSIIVAIGIADSVHILNTFNEQYLLHGEKKRAAEESLRKNLTPIFLTSVSTAVGFFSLIPSDIRPVSDLGLLAGIATLMALLYTYLMAIPLIELLPLKRPHFSVAQQTFSRARVTRYVAWLRRRAWSITALSLLFTALAVILALNNEINSNPYRYFQAQHPMAVSNDFLITRLGGVYGPEIVIDSEVPDGVNDPAFLKRVETLQLQIEKRPYVNRVISIIDVLKEINQALHRGEKQYYRLPSERRAVAEGLLLYTLGLPEGIDLSNRVDLKRQKLRLSVFWSRQNSRQAVAAMDEIQAEAQQMGLKVEITGKSSLFQRMNRYVVNTFFSSMGSAFLVITLILIVVFRSLKTGLLSLIPNVTPLCFGALLLYLMQKPVDVGAAIVASVTLGIAVDDTIHFLSHYHLLRTERGLDPEAALVEVLSSTGMALAITTLILISGFGVWIFASLVPNQNFGLLCTCVLFFALVCDFLFLPALLFLRRNGQAL